jgi:hypothetical protein
MFGYIKPYKPELKIREYEQYRGVYCSLCKQLGKRYGVLLRFSLSYDMTFFSILMMALSPDCIQFRKSRCNYNPTKKCLQCEQQSELTYTADLSALLFYYRCLDIFADESFFKTVPLRLLFPMVRSYYKRAAKRQPIADALISSMMHTQRELEAQKTASVDAAAEPFAKLLQSLFEQLSDDENQKTVLSRLGYCLGRYIYLADAADDMIKDGKKGRYNPFIFSRRVNVSDVKMVQETQVYCLDVLRNCQAECILAYQQLTVYRFDGILHNILKEGITDVIAKLYDKKLKKGSN